MSRLSYTELWNKCIVKQTKLSDITYSTNRIIKSKSRYETVVANTPIPWYFVGIIHSMEADNSFTCHIHNGDPLTHRTVQVPKGRPVADPAAGVGHPYSWEESCLDCCHYKAWQDIKVWDIETLMYQFERNNGFGYKTKDVNSPYLWSYTNEYIKGKYVADGKFDPEAVSKQAGCASLLKTLISQNIVIL